MMITKSRDSTNRVIAFFDMTFVSLVNVVMERIFESQCVVLIGAADSDDKSTNDSFIASPTERNNSGSEEKSRSNDFLSEIFFNTPLFHMPAYNFKIGICFVENFNLMQSIVTPVIALVNVPRVEVIVSIVVMSEVVGQISESPHQINSIKY